VHLNFELRKLEFTKSQALGTKYSFLSGLKKIKIGTYLFLITFCTFLTFIKAKKPFQHTKVSVQNITWYKNTLTLAKSCNKHIENYKITQVIVTLVSIRAICFLAKSQF